jgi:hypothetical protein
MPSADHGPSSRFALAIVVAGLVALASSADAGDAPSGVAAPPEAAPPGGDVVADDCGAFALRLMIGEHAPGRRGAGAIGLAPAGSR